jgi:glycosyltransferase involved in cell wall biosynthesis
MPELLSKRIARVVTIHDLVWKIAGDTMHWINRLAERVLMPRAIRLADRIVAVSRSTATGLATYFPASIDKTEVVYLGAAKFPESSIAAEEVLGTLEIDRPYFLFVGTLEPRKNLQRLLEAYIALQPEQRARMLFVIAGGKGWGNQDLAGMIKAADLGASVRLTGYVSEERLAILYKHASFLVMPSIYEGFGLPLLEAMSLGTPVMTSSTSSLPEVAGEAGHLVDPEDAASILAGLHIMIMDDRYRQSLADKAELVASRFTWEKTAHGVMSAIKCAVEQRKKVYG